MTKRETLVFYREQKELYVLIILPFKLFIINRILRKATEVNTNKQGKNIKENYQHMPCCQEVTLQGKMSAGI